MAQIVRNTSKGQLVALTFMQDAVAASQTDVQLPIAEVNAGAGNAIDEYVMPWAGEVVGIGWTLSAAATAGQLTIGATLAGTEDADTTQTITTAQRGSAKFPRGKMTFDAGARLGAEITTNAGWDATTADLAVTLFVLLYLEGI